jgi:hypothetical protein
VIELTELKRIQRAAEALVAPLAKASPEQIVAALRPRDADYAAVFVGDAAARAQAGFAALWNNPPRGLGQPGQTEVHAFATQAESFASENEHSREFPGGYRKVAGQLKPDVVWLRFKLVAPGESTGMAYDGLVYLGDHWAWFPKPWHVLGS